MKEITLPAKADALYEALRFITEAAGESGYTKDLMKLELVVEEIFINIASYAYGEKDGFVELQCGVENEGGNALFVIRFKDTGVPYDPLQREDPDITCPAEERPIGGLGVYLVKENADVVRYAYEGGKNVLTIGMGL